MDKPVVLIIEDCLDMSRFYEIVFARAGYEVICAGDGRQAYNRLASDMVPHLILLDLHLPGMNGVELLDWIKQQPHLQTTTTIVISGNINAAENIRHLVNYVFFKPISLAHIKRVAEHLFPPEKANGSANQDLADLVDPNIPFHFKNAEKGFRRGKGVV